MRPEPLGSPMHDTRSRQARSCRIAVYQGSDGDATKALYAQLEQLGPIGAIALNLFRAQKNSERAKKYRGGNSRGRYRDQAYDRKAWAMGNLAQALTAHAQSIALSWGWGIDAEQAYHTVVLYIDLPTGQVSFHTDRRQAIVAGLSRHVGQHSRAVARPDPTLRRASDCTAGGECLTFRT